MMPPLERSTTQDPYTGGLNLSTTQSTRKYRTGPLDDFAKYRGPCRSGSHQKYSVNIEYQARSRRRRAPCRPVPMTAQNLHYQDKTQNKIDHRSMMFDFDGFRIRMSADDPRRLSDTRTDFTHFQCDEASNGNTDLENLGRYQDGCHPDPLG